MEIKKTEYQNNHVKRTKQEWEGWVAAFMNYKSVIITTI